MMNEAELRAALLNIARARGDLYPNPI